MKKDIESTKVFLDRFLKRSIKLKWFQTKVCCRIPATNSILKDTGVVENNECHFCLKEKDVFNHFVYQCENFQSLRAGFEMDTITVIS